MRTTSASSDPPFSIASFSASSSDKASIVPPYISSRHALIFFASSPCIPSSSCRPAPVSSSASRSDVALRSARSAAVAASTSAFSAASSSDPRTSYTSFAPKADVGRGSGWGSTPTAASTAFGGGGDGGSERELGSDPRGDSTMSRVRILWVGQRETLSNTKSAGQLSTPAYVTFRNGPTIAACAPSASRRLRPRVRHTHAGHDRHRRRLHAQPERPQAHRPRTGRY